MSAPLLCPKCLGSRVQAAPPGVPPGQTFSSTSVGPWPCVICEGEGLIFPPLDERPPGRSAAARLMADRFERGLAKLRDGGKSR